MGQNFNQGRKFSKQSNLALIVEDDEDLRNFAVTLVSEVGFDVIDCDTVETALEIMEERGDQIAVVFTDINLAGELDGVQLAQTVANRWPRVNLIVTSGGQRVRLDRLPEKACFMPKPYQAIDLMVAVEHARPGSP